MDEERRRNSPLPLLQRSSSVCLGVCVRAAVYSWHNGGGRLNNYCPKHPLLTHTHTRRPPPCRYIRSAAGRWEVWVCASAAPPWRTSQHEANLQQHRWQQHKENHKLTQKLEQLQLRGSRRCSVQPAAACNLLQRAACNLLQPAVCSISCSLLQQAASCCVSPGFSWTDSPSASCISERRPQHATQTSRVMTLRLHGNQVFTVNTVPADAWLQQLRGKLMRTEKTMAGKSRRISASRKRKTKQKNIPDVTQQKTGKLTVKIRETRPVLIRRAQTHPEPKDETSFRTGCSKGGPGALCGPLKHSAAPQPQCNSIQIQNDFIDPREKLNVVTY